MDMYTVELFVMTASMQNFSKAADAMSVTQSTLSQQIRRLESELGYPLFTRQKGQRTVTLTEQGQEFLTLATKIQNLWQKALKIGEAEQKERLRISIMESVLNYAVPDLMHNFLQKHPDTQLMIRNQYSKDALSYVERGELDIAIIRDVQPSPGLVISSLFSDPWVMICGRGVYQLPDVISPTRLDGKQQLYLLGSNDLDWNKHWFPENKNASVISHTLSVIGKNTFESAKWAIVPYTVARHLKGIYDIELHYFTESPPPRVIYLALRNQEPTQIVKEFLFQLYEELRKVSGITLLF